MSEIVLGDIVAKITGDASGLLRALTEARTALAQFGQAMQQASTASQAFQQMATAINTVSTAQTQTTASAQRLTQQLTLLNQQAISQTGYMAQAAASLGRLEQAIQGTTRTAQQGQQAAQQFGSMWQTALSVASGIGLATSIGGIVRAIVNLSTESVQLAAHMQDLNATFRAIDGSAEGANRTLSFLFTTAQRVGIDFTSAADSFKRLDAAARGTSIEGEGVRRVFEGVVAGARALGSSSQQVSQAIVALEQILTKGRLSAEEYRRQLGNAIPGALKAMADSFGVTTPVFEQMIRSGLIPATAAVVAFSEGMQHLADQGGAVDRLSATFARFKNEVGAWMTAIGEGIATVLDPLLKKLTEVSEAARSLLGIRTPGTTAPPTPALPVAQNTFTPLIQEQARAQGIDPGLLSQVIRAESNFNPQAVSPKGAIGLGQVMLPTAQGLERDVTRENLAEPERNVRLTAKYLAEMFETTRAWSSDLVERTKLAVAAYNAGPGRVEEAIKAFRTSESPTGPRPPFSYDAIAARLPADTQRYVAAVTTPPAGTPAAAAPPPAMSARTTEAMRDDILKTLKEFPALQEQIERVSKSALNFGNMLGDPVRREADELVKKFTQTAELLARFPQVMAALTTEQQAQLTTATQQVSVFQASLGSDQARLALLKSQVQTLESLTVARRAELLATTQGQAAAERFRREATQDLQQKRIDDQPRLAALTLQQQLASYASRLQQLTADANALGTQVETQRANLLRPQLEEELKRLQGLLAKPEMSVAERARQGAEQPYEREVVAAQKAMQQIATNPMLEDLREKFQQAFADISEAMAVAGQEAFDKADVQMQDRVTKISSEILKIREQIGESGLSPLDTDLQKIRDHFAQMSRSLLTLQQQLKELAPGATPERQAEIALEQRRIAATLPQLKPAEQAALDKRILEPQEAYLKQLGDRLEQLRAPRDQGGFPFGPTPEDIRLDQKGFTATGESRLQTPEGRAQAQALKDQIQGQERLNYLLDRVNELGNAVGQSWTNALLSIADGTKTVSQAFRDMARSIMQSLIQISSQEAFKAVFRIGIGLITSAATGAAGGADFGGAGASDFGGGGSFATAEPATMAFQHGGKVTSPTIALIGEAGPEYVVTERQMAAMQARMAPVTQAMAHSGPGQSPVPFRMLAEGGIVRTPTLAMLGEGGSPEYVMNQRQMGALMGSASQAMTPAGAQVQNHVSIINVANEDDAQRAKMQEEALGHITVVNHVLRELSAGESSRINRMIRSLQK